MGSDGERPSGRVSCAEGRARRVEDDRAQGAAQVPALALQDGLEALAADYSVSGVSRSAWRTARSTWTRAVRT